MLQLDPTTQASLEAATTPNARAAAIVSSLSGTITVTVRDGTGSTKGSGTMTSFGVQSANVIVLNNVTSFTVSETGTPDPATWTIEFANAGGRFVKGTFGLYTSPVAEFKWSLATWENGQSGTIASAYCTVRKNEVLTDAVDTFNVAAAPTNQTPYWLTSRPASLSGSSGSVLQLAQYATDPDNDALTYTIPSYIPPGYSINATTGALTIGTTSQTLTIRVSDGIASADWSLPVTVSTAGALKWFPGHYAVPDASLIPSKLSAHTTLWNQIAPVANFVGGSILVPWGQVETSQDVYDWSAVDAQIAALAAIGKKTSIHTKFEVYTSSALPTVASNDANVNRYFPSYAIAAGHVVAARNADQTLSGRQELKYWNAAAVDRFIAFYSALAAKYDNDERVICISTPETSIAIDYPDPTSTWTNTLTQWRRILSHINSVFVRTPVIVSNNFLQTQTVTTSFQQEIIDSIAGCGGPDMFIPSLETSDNWGMRALRGERYNGTAWIPGVAEDQTYKVAVSVQQQVVRSMSATPALYYDAAVNRYGNTHTEWWAKTTVYQYGHSNDPAYRIPAMDWVNVLAYIRDNNLPLRTTIPTGLR